MTKTVALIVPNDWYLFTHRKELVSELLKNGHNVHVLTALESDGTNIPAPLKKCTFHRFEFKGNDQKSLSIIKKVWSISRVLHKIKPDIAHAITIRSFFLTFYLALQSNTRFIVSIAGLGALHNIRPPKSYFAVCFTKLIRALHGFTKTHYIFQNTYDACALLGADALTAQNDRIHLIRGAGVDFSHYAPSAQPNTNRKRILFASRLLKSKGVFEFIDAIKIANSSHDLIPTLACRLDESGSDAVSEAELRDYASTISCELFFDVTDLSELMRETAIFTLPTRYAEGLPKVVLEAMASGSAIITTDWPDVESVVEHLSSGIVIPKANLSAQTIADAITLLAKDTDLRTKISANAREHVKENFSVHSVVARHMAIYSELLNG